MKIADSTVGLTKSEIENCKGDIKLIDGRWASKNENLIIGRVKKAVQTIEHEKELETPLKLLQDALSKLNHENMDPDSLDTYKIDEAFKVSKEIQERAHELEKEFWERKQRFKKLINKK